MPTSFLDHLNSGAVLVADGATGTNLHAAGLPAGTPPEAWVLDAPGAVRDLHRAFVAAGADVVLTCTFGAGRHRLGRAALAARAAEVNRRAVALAREAAEGAGRPVYVAGSMGPTGELVEPYGPLTLADIADAYAEQAAVLADAGVDLLVLETFFALEEAEAAVTGVRRAAGLPLVCSFSYDRGGRTMMGVRPAQMAAAMARMGVDVLGVNCGTGLAATSQVVAELSGATRLPLWVKPNAGLPHGTPPQYEATPAVMAEAAAGFVARGARVVGGCCGTTPAHLAAVAAVVKARAPAA